MYEWWFKVAAPFPILAKGGPVMLLIVLCSSMVVAVTVDRFWILVVRAKRIVPPGLIAELKALLRAGEVEKACWVCERDRSSLARVFLVGLNNLGQPRDIIKEDMEEAGRHEVLWMSRYLGLLSAITRIATLLGLLGTVTGMIRIFSSLSIKEAGNLSTLAGGISEVLMATAAGLVVAIPTLLIYQFFTTRVQNLARIMEQDSSAFIGTIARLGQPEPNPKPRDQ